MKEYFDFRNKLSHLYSQSNVICADNKVKGVGEKKVHELTNISSFVRNHFCQNKTALNIVDIGCGLGHLMRYLTTDIMSNEPLMHVSMLGIEGNADLHARNTPNIGGMDTANFHVTSDNVKQLSRLIEGRLPPGRDLLLTGLHCCGPLSGHILSLYAATTKDSENCNHLLLFSCCYHRCSVPLTPLSRVFRDMPQLKPFSSPYALRLAAQESACKWLQWSEDEVAHHRKTVALRSALTRFSEMEPHADLEKLRRVRLPRQAASKMSLMEFAEPAIQRLEDAQQREQMTECLQLEEHSDRPHWYSVMLALQMALQEVLELLLLLDRLCFLQETAGVGSARLVRLFDPSISPRGIALVASSSKP